ncbi:1-phosphofructokinase family hexose kinase [Haematomicrobium sanguinis]|uniref:1-phosphofructokinase family hexose kinase n=1 Tax=Haematomicrobium sanguinis TaxID=479106 RepID=UPI00047B9164|nr:1-phosphofructokinase [Haematomicrobium sanguinis]
MIVTLTVNPSLDRTIELAGELRRGEVQRATASGTHPGGKGVNISRALERTGLRTVAVLPDIPDGDLTLQLDAEGINFLPIHTRKPARSNVTITEPDGVTTKINEPGPELDRSELDEIFSALLGHREYATWFVLAGSLPPGLAPSYYADLMTDLRTQLGESTPQFAIDASGPALAFAADNAPNLIKPNSDELAELLAAEGVSTWSPEQLEADPALTATASRTLVERGVGAVLATLGARGAVLTTREGAWHGRPRPIRARSTVGAGDAALAGYLFAREMNDADAPLALATAVAFGSAAAGLPGTEMPLADEVDPSTVTITPLP